MFQNIFIASFGPLDPGAKFDEEGTGWGWKTIGSVNGRRYGGADHLQDGAAAERRTVAPADRDDPLICSSVDAQLSRSAQRRAARHAAVHAVERADADLQHDGRAQFRARQLLHARRLFWLRDRRHARLLAGLVFAPLLVGVLGALVERYGLRRVHRLGHVAELLFTFGLAYLIEERSSCSGASCRAIIAYRPSWISSPSTFSTPTFPPTACS